MCSNNTKIFFILLGFWGFGAIKVYQKLYLKRRGSTP